MQRDPLKVASVLGDPTRYAVYHFILQSGRRAVTAAEVAGHFRLHPNVARMHLNKLQEIGLLASAPEKSGRGGRPVHAYAVTGRAVSVSVPHRDFQLLAALLSEALAALGDPGLAALGGVGRSYGQRLARETLAAAGVDPAGATEQQLLELAAQALDVHGIAVAAVPTVDGADLLLRNCGFREVALLHPQHVCQLCEAIVQGISEVMFGALGIAPRAAVPRGDRHCVYHAPTYIRVDLAESGTIRNGSGNPGTPQTAAECDPGG